MFAERLKNVRDKKPLIHNITNYVTMNDCANILLACGASPIMAQAIQEVEEITTICNGLNLNIGTLDQGIIPSMITAGKKSNQIGHPIVLDPVGAGASTFRTNTALELINQINFTVIRGNISEIKALALQSNQTKGVDANILDQVTEENLSTSVNFAKMVAQKMNAIIAITGTIDIVSDSQTTYCIRNGTQIMGRVTGTGCQLSAMMAAYLAANPDCALEAAAASVCAMGLCGEKAKERMSDLDGNASYRNYIIDAVYHLTPTELEKGAKYEMR